MNLKNSKLMTLGEVVTARDRWRLAGQQVVLTNGVFDLLHTGHLYSLQAARALGDVLVVAINSDASVRAIKGPTRPVQGELERAYALGALACVDAVIVFRDPRLTAEIRSLRPDIYCKAGDYTFDKLDPEERAALVQQGTRISIVPYLTGFSTTGLIAKIKAAGEI